MKPAYETLIIGAGLVGSSAAMHLAKRGMSGICVVDFDLEGTLSSSELNAGGVRATWIQPVNIRSSQVSIEYYAKVAAEVGYRACGYLWLHTKQNVEVAMRARKKQVASGWPVEAWDAAELTKRVPFIDKTDDIGVAMFSPRDGLINPNLLKEHYRRDARAKGVEFVDRVLIRSAEYDAGAGVVRLKGEKFAAALSDDDKNRELTRHPDLAQSGTPVEFVAKRVINCAGAWAPGIARILKYPCSSRPVRRQACIFDSREVDLTPFGMIVDTSGVYFHPEAAQGLAGFADPNEPAGLNFNYDGMTFFEERIWPALYERSTGFESLKHVTGWAGLYETSLDHCAIIGKVTQGEAGRSGKIYEAHSFSGHGTMHSYAAGQGIAELITGGRYESVDFTELAGDRFEKGRPVSEKMVI